MVVKLKCVEAEVIMHLLILQTVILGMILHVLVTTVHTLCQRGCEQIGHEISNHIANVLISAQSDMSPCDWSRYFLLVPTVISCSQH